MDLLSAVKTFVTIVEAGSFTVAADRLQVSAAAVSRHLATLEEHLGARLLDRTTRRHRLTEIGEACFERYARILSDLEQTREFALTESAQPKGVLRVTSTVLFWMWRIAPILPDFMRQHPSLDIQVNLTERLIDLVEESYDIALQIQPPLSQTVVARRITRLERVVCASPDFLKQNGAPEAPGALAHYECLLYASNREPVEWRFLKDGEELAVNVTGRLRSTDANTLRLAAIAGMGIIRGPRFILEEDLRDGRLKQIMQGYQSIDPYLLAVFPTRRLLPAKVRVFVDFLMQRFGDVH